MLYLFCSFAVPNDLEMCLGAHLFYKTALTQSLVSSKSVHITVTRTKLQEQYPRDRNVHLLKYVSNTQIMAGTLPNIKDTVLRKTNILWFLAWIMCMSSTLPRIRNVLYRTSTKNSLCFLSLPL